MQMIRSIATVAAGAVVLAGLALIPPLAQAAPQSTTSAGADLPLQLAPPPAPHRKVQHGGDHSAQASAVMRGRDTTALIAMLPWWRTDNLHALGFDTERYESPILTSYHLRLGMPAAAAAAKSEPPGLAANETSELDLVSNRIRIVDPGELNEIDLTAPDEARNININWLWPIGLLATLAVALAAIPAVRYLTA